MLNYTAKNASDAGVKVTLCVKGLSSQTEARPPTGALG